MGLAVHLDELLRCEQVGARFPAVHRRQPLRTVEGERHGLVPSLLSDQETPAVSREIAGVLVMHPGCSTLSREGAEVRVRCRPRGTRGMDAAVSLHRVAIASTWRGLQRVRRR